MSKRKHENVPKEHLSSLSATIDELTVVLNESPRCIPSDDGIYIEWDYTTIDGNQVTIYGYQQFRSTSVCMPWYVKEDWQSSANREIRSLLTRKFGYN